MAPLLEVRDLTKVYTRRRRAAPLYAVDHISLDVQAGEVLGILGPNGAGKTTTIRVCTGISRPTSGHVRVAGHDVAEHPIRVKERIGVVSDVVNLYREMTVADNLHFVGELHGVARRTRTERIAALLQRFGLEDRLRSPVGSLSTGLRKRLMIAAALVHEPSVLFLDEPTTGLDVQSAREIRRLICELSGSGITVILTTHYIEEADQLCGRVAILNRGKIVTIGTPEELKRAVQSEQILEVSLDGDAATVAERLGTGHRVHQVRASGATLRFAMADARATLPLVFAASEECGRSVMAISTLRPTLEDAFVALTGLRAEGMGAPEDATLEGHA